VNYDNSLVVTITVTWLLMGTI